MSRKGDGSTIQIAGPTLLSPTGGYSYAFWSWFPADPTTAAIRSMPFAYVTAGSGDIAGFTYDETNAAYTTSCYQPGGGSYPKVQFAAGLLVGGRWYHIAYTWDTATMRAYRNGVLEGSTADAVPPSGGQVFLWAANGARYSSAAVAEFGWWQNVALTPGEIRALAQGVRPRDIRPNALKWYMPLTEDGRDSANGNVYALAGAKPFGPAPLPARFPLGARL